MEDSELCWNDLLQVGLGNKSPTQIYLPFYLNRFIYVRYASGIVGREGIKLFHGLVFLFIGTFSIHNLLIWPIRYHIDGSVLDTIKGKICLEKDLTNNSSDTNVELDQLEVSIKPKLMIFSLVTMFWGLGQFYFWSAIKARYETRAKFLSHIIFLLVNSLTFAVWIRP